ncbi:MAG: DUF4286 family protein [Bacteroidetes bacterium]|nr:DUF4286 family protein [Bacteroidota bacterium]
MIVYNVTVKIDTDVHDEWFSWMKEEHIPEVMKTGLFADNNMMKVLVDEADGITYSIQYKTTSWENLEEYQTKHAPALQKVHTDKYQGKFVAFRTLLEDV